METSTEFGRVDPDGTVHVLDGDQWRPVGSFPDGSPDEALAYFQRKYADLAAGVTLAEQRLKASAPIKDLRAQVQKLTDDLLSPAAVGDLPALRARVNAVAEALPAREEEQKAANEAQVTEALAFRTDLVIQIEALAAKDPASVRWKQATDTIASLFDAWQNHQQTGPRLPKKEADELWNRFRKARTQLERARRAHFAQLDERSKEAKTIKRDLISQAEALASKGAQGIPAYRALLEKWKAAPRASRSIEDGLWAKFKAAGDALYAQKAEQDKKDDEVNAVNLESKSALLDEFQDILQMTDRQQASDRLRLFHTKFSAIGPVPKRDVRSVDDRVKKLDAHVKSLNEEFWVKNDPEKKARSSSMADQLRAAIADLEKQLETASGSEKERLSAELETKLSWLQVVDA
jgi:hypothetical protein